MRALLALPLLLAACGPADHDDDHDPAQSAAETVDRARASADVDGIELSADVPGALVDEVATRDGSVVLGVTDAVLYTRLSPDLQAQIADEMEAEVGDVDGFGATIARTITGAVAEGLRTAVSVPLADIRDIRYEDERLVIEMVDGEEVPFENARVDDEPLLDAFDADAGARLVEAFAKAAGR